MSVAADTTTSRPMRTVMSVAVDIITSRPMKTVMSAVTDTITSRPMKTATSVAADITTITTLMRYLTAGASQLLSVLRKRLLRRYLTSSLGVMALASYYVQRV